MKSGLKALLDSPDRDGLAANIAAGALATGLVCAVIAMLGWMDPAPADIEALPGAVVGGVWAVLIAGLGAARWLAGRAGPDGRDLQGFITVLAAACLLYPFYTGGLSSLTGGLAANAVIAVGCAFLADRLMPLSRGAAVLVALPVPWLIVASVIIGQEWLVSSR
jgi:hypothetical protein